MRNADISEFPVAYEVPAMVTLEEMMMQDAAGSPSTAYTLSVGDSFTGNLENRADEDWVLIELQAGTTYRISVAGHGAGGVRDTILKLFDSHGGLIDENDDVNPAARMFNSALTFYPSVSGSYYLGVSSYRGNPTQDNSGAYRLTVMEVPDITGTELADTLTGTAEGERIAGLDGDDTLSGGAGSDLLEGGPGADTLNGGANESTGDTITYRNSGMGVTIDLLTGLAEGGEAKGDMVGNDIENVEGSRHADSLTGDGMANRLWGLAGDDTLGGGAGNDTLNGGPGNDNLTGGAGNDIFVFSPDDGYGEDVITDFSTADDMLNLSAFGIEEIADLVLFTTFRGNSAVIDLTSLDGGTILLEGVTDLDVRDDFNGVADTGMGEIVVIGGITFIL